MISLAYMLSMGVSRANDAPDLRRKDKERNDVHPMAAPGGGYRQQFLSAWPG